MKLLELDIITDRAAQFKINGEYVRLFVNNDGTTILEVRDPRTELQVRTFQNNSEKLEFKVNKKATR